MSIRLKSEKITVARLARVLSVMAIAMAAGHLAQTLAARKQVQKVEADVQSGAMAVAQVMITRPTDIVLMSAGSTAAPIEVLAQPASEARQPDPVTLLAAAPDVADVPLAPAAKPVEMAASCPIDLALDLGEGGMMGVDVLAPCHADQRVVLRHAGLAVTFKLDGAGRLAVDVPVLLADARVEVGFADGNTVEGALRVEEAAGLRRFGVQWQGGEAFALHGFENGADFNQPGHVSPLRPRGPGGGVLAVLGDASVDLPLLAQIYTYPERATPVELLVQAAVTLETCGQELLGEVIAVEAGAVAVTELTLVMPECSGVGDFLVLKNLPAEMKLATN